LSRRQKELLEEFQQSMDDADVKHSPRSSNWFDGVKKFFDDMKF
ncbi:MAG TPA: molecular chaperone DnaJ, partial [Candidatus Tenderia sp.]|nr:molecular chaperone DnaJ [Candidatus Tenderia sp.]